MSERQRNTDTVIEGRKGEDLEDKWNAHTAGISGLHDTREFKLCYHLQTLNFNSDQTGKQMLTSISEPDQPVVLEEMVSRSCSLRRVSRPLGYNTHTHKQTHAGTLLSATSFLQILAWISILTLTIHQYAPILSFLPSFPSFLPVFFLPTI